MQFLVCAAIESGNYDAGLGMTKIVFSSAKPAGLCPGARIPYQYILDVVPNTSPSTVHRVPVFFPRLLLQNAARSTPVLSFASSALASPVSVLRRSCILILLQIRVLVQFVLRLLYSFRDCRYRTWREVHRSRVLRHRRRLHRSQHDGRPQARRNSLLRLRQGRRHRCERA